MEQTNEFCVIWLNYAIWLRLWMRASMSVWFCFLFIFIEASLHNSQICPFLMTLITLFHIPSIHSASGCAHTHTKSFYNAYQFKMYVIFYLVLLSNFNFVHMTKMAAFSTQNQKKKEIKSSIETDKLWLDLFILHITNWIIAYDDYLLNELQLCSAKRSQFLCTVHFFDSSLRLSLFLSFSPFKNIMWTKFINKSMNEWTNIRMSDRLHKDVCMITTRFNDW